MNRFISVITGATACSFSFGQILLNTDFSTGLPAEFSGAGALEDTQGFAGNGVDQAFGGDFLRNESLGDASTFTFTNLSAHSSISIGFLLGVIDSWDSTDGTDAPDYFAVKVDGVQVFSATFNNASGTTNYGGLDITGGRSDMGWDSWDEQGFDMYAESALQNIAHTSSSLEVSFLGAGDGWQGESDESWGIDNLTITATPVPEPSSLLALAGAALLLRRRSR